MCVLRCIKNDDTSKSKDYGVCTRKNQCNGISSKAPLLELDLPPSTAPLHVYERKFYDVFKGESRENKARLILFQFRNSFVNLLFSFNDVFKGHLKRCFGQNCTFRQPLCKLELKQKRKEVFRFFWTLLGELCLTCLLVYLGRNSCAWHNGGCSHLCLAKPSKRMVCSCQTHYTLSPTDSTTCHG